MLYVVLYKFKREARTYWPGEVFTVQESELEDWRPIIETYHPVKVANRQEALRISGEIERGAYVACPKVSCLIGCWAYPHPA